MCSECLVYIQFASCVQGEVEGGGRGIFLYSTSFVSIFISKMVRNSLATF